MGKWKGLLLVSIFGMVMGLGCYFLWEPLSYFVMHPQMIQQMGSIGILAMIGAFLIQIVLAFLPGEMLEIMAGMIYGPWWGLAICLMGSLLGSSFVFMMVKKLGEPIVEKFFSKEKIQSLKFLKDERRLTSALFIIFLIPGTPKDLLTYVMPLTNISLKSFLLITTIARIPSVLTSTLGGGWVASHDYLMAGGILS